MLTAEDLRGAPLRPYGIGAASGLTRLERRELEADVVGVRSDDGMPKLRRGWDASKSLLVMEGLLGSAKTTGEDMVFMLSVVVGMD